MNPSELQTRKDRAATEPLVISRNNSGYRVYSTGNPRNQYQVTVEQGSPACTCPDFQTHGVDPDWRCKHILAVFSRGEGTGDPSPSDPTSDPKPPADPSEQPPPKKRRASKPTNGIAQMLLKRSVSPDGRIDSLSVEFSCPVEEVPATEIKERARKILTLQAAIVGTFLNGKEPQNGQPDAPEPTGDGAVSAQILNIAGMQGKWGRRLFINVQVNGQTLKLFGNRTQLAEHLAGAGYANLTAQIEEGVSLRVPCRAITKPSPDGRYINVEAVLPALTPDPQGRSGR